jgi:hypothetical protein
MKKEVNNIGTRIAMMFALATELKPELGIIS